MSRILVMDDDELLRDSICQMLTSKGYEVVPAKDGKEGMRRLSEDVYDLVITDILMPERDGVEAIMDMRSSNPGVPIIAMSGGGKRSGSEYLEYASLMGAAYVFQKPIDTEHLLAAVRECLLKD